MGIPRATARLILDEHRRQPFSGSILQLGRMNIYFNDTELAQWAAAQHVPLTAGVPVQPSHDPRLAACGCIDDQTFFRRLGFDEVRSCDCAAWEGVDYVFDLNRPVPEALRGRFDCVLESGTIQHIFHLPQVLRNIHDLLKVGGRVIHGMVPSNNHVDHGFYMFSPTLFQDWYAAAGYRLEQLLLCEFVPVWYRTQFVSGPWKIYRYTPGCLDHLSYGGMGRRQLAIFCVATRTAEASAEVIPQQGAYARVWNAPQGAADDAAQLSPVAAPRPHPNIAARLGPLGPVYLRVRRTWKELLRWLPSRMPPIMARY